MKQSSFIDDSRTLVWFSCGAASACAAKLALDKFDNVEVCYCDTLAYEHPDNRRFLADVEAWLGVQVKLLRSAKFTDIYDVFNRERYLKGRHGAPCTRALKRDVRGAYQEPWDSHVFGFTADEQHRIRRFEKENPEIWCEWVLSEAGISKNDCYRMVKQAGIELPEMYKLGFTNNNCIGCVKGGAGYWNKVRRHFPESFWKMASTERTLGYALLRIRGKPCFLDELPPDAGRYEDEPDIECGPQCVPPSPSTVKGE